MIIFSIWEATRSWRFKSFPASATISSRIALVQLIRHADDRGAGRGPGRGRWSSNQIAPPPLKPAPREGPLLVSFVQERLWFLDQLMPGSHAYNVPLALRLKGH